MKVLGLDHYTDLSENGSISPHLPGEQIFFVEMEPVWFRLSTWSAALLPFCQHSEGNSRGKLAASSSLSTDVFFENYTECLRNTS